jgi:hypothetical protein
MSILTPHQVKLRAYEVLVRELGFVDALRFLQQYELGQGDYTKERESMLPDWTARELLRRATGNDASVRG